MELRSPLCGNGEAHVEHRLWSGAVCPGWARWEADTVAMVRQLDAIALDGRMPADAALECGQWALHCLTRVFSPEPADVDQGVPTEVVTQPVRVPVTTLVRADLAKGAWRLTDGTETVAEGQIGETT